MTSRGLAPAESSRLSCWKVEGGFSRCDVDSVAPIGMPAGGGFLAYRGNSVAPICHNGGWSDPGQSPTTRHLRGGGGPAEARSVSPDQPAPGVWCGRRPGPRRAPVCAAAAMRPAPRRALGPAGGPPTHLEAWHVRKSPIPRSAAHSSFRARRRSRPPGAVRRPAPLVLIENGRRGARRATLRRRILPAHSPYLSSGLRVGSFQQNVDAIINRMLIESRHEQAQETTLRTPDLAD